jgi:cell division septation protein DedD
MGLDLFIKERLYTSDCVIVPGLGGFVVQHKSASMQPSRNAFNPPSRHVLFNANLRSVDGDFIRYVAGRKGISYNRAVTWIDEEVSRIREQLAFGVVVPFGTIGKFLLNENRTVAFEPDSQHNFLDESFGLSSIQSPAIRREQEGARVRSLFGRKDRRRSLKLVEVLSAAAILAILLFNPRVIDSVNTGLAEMLPVREWTSEPVTEKPAEEKVTEPSTDESTLPMQDSIHFPADPLAQPVEPIAPADTTEVVTPATTIHAAVAPEPTAVSTASAIHTYHIIAGCFRIEENANRLVSQASAAGFQASVIGKNDMGLYVVSVFSSTDQRSVDQKLQEVRQNMEANAWVMVK